MKIVEWTQKTKDTICCLRQQKIVSFLLGGVYGMKKIIADIIIMTIRDISISRIAEVVIGGCILHWLFG